MILSSSPDFLVEAFANKMGVAWEATVYGTDQQGRYSSIKKILEGLEKSKLVKRIIAERGISSQHTSAYTDSYHDLLLLEEVAEPVAVNPSLKLRRICNSRGWKILSTSRWQRKRPNGS